MITGGDLRQSRLDVGYKTFTISPWEGMVTQLLNDCIDTPAMPARLLKLAEVRW